MTSIDWIATIDRLPDDDEAVLISFANGDVWVAFHDDDKWRDLDAMPLDGLPTHWSHFPEPPQCCPR